MPKINIHLGNVNESNSRMTRYIMELSDVKKELEILKWKLDKEVMKKNGLNNRYESILRELRCAEEDMEKIKTHIAEGTESYRQTEKKLLNRQNIVNSKFM